MAPQPSPPQPTHSRPEHASETNYALDTDRTRDVDATPSLPALLSVGGLVILYMIALTAIGVRRAVVWPLAVVRTRGS